MNPKSGYTPCSKTCGSGLMHRYWYWKGIWPFFCDDCLDEQVCNPHPCPQWEAWSNPKCSTTCGPGTRTRARKCKDSNGNELQPSFCSGDAEQIVDCNIQECRKFFT